jgi:DNA-binding MarR family transcriptional regulator
VRDAIDEHVALWQRELPDLDANTEAIVTRMGLLLRRLSRARQRALDGHGLQVWEYKTLLDLRRRGISSRASPTELAAALGVSAPAMTKRLTALESRGYVERAHSRRDRRRVEVTLTDAGLRAWIDATAAQGKVEQELLAALDATEQELLAALLRRLVAAGGDGDLPQLRRA